VAYEALAIVTFIFIDKKITGSNELAMWKKNYSDGGCGELEMTYALQNACLNGCAYLSA